MARTKNSNASSVLQAKRNSSAKVVLITHPAKIVWDAILHEISLEIDAGLSQAKVQKKALLGILRCDYLKSTKYHNYGLMLTFWITITRRLKRVRWGATSHGLNISLLFLKLKMIPHLACSK